MHKSGSYNKKWQDNAFVLMPFYSSSIALYMNRRSNGGFFLCCSVFKSLRFQTSYPLCIIYVPLSPDRGGDRVMGVTVYDAWKGTAVYNVDQNHR